MAAPDEDLPGEHFVFTIVDDYGPRSELPLSEAELRALEVWHEALRKTHTRVVWDEAGGHVMPEAPPSPGTGE